MTTWQDRITIDPAILTGKPVIRGTRLSVDFIIGLLADGRAKADILRNYPGLAHEDIAACLRYASDVLRSERVYPLAIGAPGASPPTSGRELWDRLSCGERMEAESTRSDADQTPRPAKFE